MPNSDYMPWVELYRPRSLSEIIGQKEIISRLQGYVKTGNMPHLMFAGPAGTGKTTAALALAHDLYGEDYKYNLLELNASVTPETPILIRRNGSITRTNFAELDKLYFLKNDKRVQTTDLEVLSIDDEYNVQFSDVSYIYRHKKSKVAKIIYEGGFVRTSLDHSLIILDKNGDFLPKTAADLSPGDFLVTFKTNYSGNQGTISLEDYKPRLMSNLKSGLQRNPKTKVDLVALDLDEDMSLAMGLYLAEGCTSIGNTSSQTIYALGYPKEQGRAKQVEAIFANKGMSSYVTKGKSGFDRSRESSIQVRILNTQISKFFRDHFYDSSGHKAGQKRAPPFIFDAPIKYKIAFLKGYFDGDGCGDWNSVARFSSVSQECLIDVAWLGRLSGLETSCFRKECRIIKENQRFSYIKSDLLPSVLAHELLKEFGLTKTRLLRHSLYSKKSGRVSKSIISELVNGLENKSSRLLKKTKMLLDSDLSVLKIKSIEVEDYNDYVYDVSVPDGQMFWGGTVPILLHNSDERGIDVVRGKIKDFARAAPISNVPFKIIFLDESDALTPEAQQALRRTMELYSSRTRFILSCNWSSKIIDPIQSRCALFRFRPLTKEEVTKMLERIAKEEKLNLNNGGVDSLIEVSEGDMRKAVNILQSVSLLTKDISADSIYKVAAAARPKEIGQMIDAALGGDFVKARALLDELMLEHGMDGEDVLMQVHKNIVGRQMDDRLKLKLIDRIGEYNFRMTEGANDRIQLEALLAYMAVSKEE